MDPIVRVCTPWLGSSVCYTKQAFFAELNGRNKQTIKDFRDRTLDVKDADITRVAHKYLVPENCNTAVITNENGASTLNFENSVKI